MPQGLDHVENTLELVGKAAEAIGEMGEATWKRSAEAELAAVSDALEAMRGRFFLKSRLCVPFARRCEEAAQALVDLLRGLGAEAPSEAQAQVTDALAALAKAVKVLDERSLMQGMAIT